MTQSTTYSIFFKGEAEEGANLDQVKLHFAKLFKADDTKITQLFSGKVVALKKQVNRDDAAKFQQLFKKTGAKIYLKEDMATAPTQPATPSSAPDAPTPVAATQDIQEPPTQAVEKISTTESEASQPASPTIISDEPYQKPHLNAVNIDEINFDLSPTGSDLLSDSEKSHFVEANIDTSAMDLAAVGSNLDEIEKPPAPPAPSVDHISTAEVGATLGTPSTQPEATSPDTSHISISETGSNLQDFIDDIPDFPPNTSHLSMAELGGVIETLKQEKTLLNPDTSHIKLDENP